MLPPARQKYILGNIVGLATPLTAVTPMSKHPAAEFICLLVSVWSLSICGLIVGIVSAFSMIEEGVKRVDERIKVRTLQAGHAVKRKKTAARTIEHASPEVAVRSASPGGGDESRSQQQEQEQEQDARAHAAPSHPEKCRSINDTNQKDRELALVFEHCEAALSRALRFVRAGGKRVTGGGGSGAGAGVVESTLLLESLAAQMNVVVAKLSSHGH